MDPHIREVQLMLAVSRSIFSTWHENLAYPYLMGKHHFDVYVGRPFLSNEQVINLLCVRLPQFGKAFLSALNSDHKDINRLWEIYEMSEMPFLMFSIARFIDVDYDSAEAAEVVRFIEQFCFLWYKADFPYDEGTLDVSLIGWKANEYALQQLWINDTPEFEIARYLVRRAIGSGPDYGALKGGHGPGVVSTGEQSEEKWLFRRVHKRLEPLFPFNRFFRSRTPLDSEEAALWPKLSWPEDTKPARMIAVPKDSRGPRLISCEPNELQFLQQALKDQMVSRLERRLPSAGQVNFTRQEVNQGLALAGSVNGSLPAYSLDLRDASDLVSVQLVQALFPLRWFQAFMATRSSAVTLPRGGNFNIAKMSPMGSAVCFPILATTVWALSVAALVYHEGLSVNEASTLVFVYGDDLIVRHKRPEVCTALLELCGLAVNNSKSFTAGFYRESCGLNAYAGVVTTPVRVKKRWCGEDQGAIYANWVAVANGLFDRGYHDACRIMIKALERDYRCLVPYGTSETGFPCLVVEDPDWAEYLNFRKGIPVVWDEITQRLLWNVYEIAPVERPTTLDGFPRLLAWFSRVSMLPPGAERDQKSHRVVVDRGTTEFCKRNRAV